MAPVADAPLSQGWFSFGRAVHGELGRELPAAAAHNVDVLPVELPIPAQDAQEQPGYNELCGVRCGHFHCLARTGEGEVLAWGANGERQLGISGELGSEFFVATPSRSLRSLKAHLDGERIVDCAGGRSHSVFVSAPSGRCFMAGKLPVVEPGRRNEVVDDAARELHLVDGTGNPPQGTVVACHAGEAHNLFVTSEGEVWQWFGESATRMVTRVGMERPTARLVLGLPKVRKVSCGWQHTLALTLDGRVFAFGGGCFGQLGLGSCRQCPSPSHVALPEECEGSAVDVAAGFACSFAATKQGWVYAWGSNEKCQLGLGTSVRGATRPKPVDALANVRVVQVSAGFSHAACITDSGLLYLWGFGSYGQLGFSFSDIKASEALGGGGGIPLTAAVPSSQGEQGAGSVGHSRPWMQVWPRRCVRGPFEQLRCAEVQCGAHHTLALCNGEQLGRASILGPEVLTPPPIVLRSVTGRSGELAGEDVAELTLGPGAGIAERSSSVLRPTDAQARSIETFRSIAETFWGTAPSRGAVPVPPPLKTHTGAAEYGKWRRALPPTELELRLPFPGFNHPLARPSNDEFDGESPLGEPYIRMPNSRGVSIWDAVDEAIHRAFADGSVADTSKALNLAELVREVSTGYGEDMSPELPGGEMNRGLPPAPCRGLARIECLTPRPFYLPISEERTGAPGAHVHGSGQPDQLGIPKDVDHAAGAGVDGVDAAHGGSTSCELGGNEGDSASAAPAHEGSPALPSAGAINPFEVELDAETPSPRHAEAGTGFLPQHDAGAGAGFLPTRAAEDRSNEGGYPPTSAAGIGAVYAAEGIAEEDDAIEHHVRPLPFVPCGGANPFDDDVLEQGGEEQAEEDEASAPPEDGSAADVVAVPATVVAASADSGNPFNPFSPEGSEDEGSVVD